jgi:hypothetical protein
MRNIDPIHLLSCASAARIVLARDVCLSSSGQLDAHEDHHHGAGQRAGGLRDAERRLAHQQRDGTCCGCQSVSPFVHTRSVGTLRVVLVLHTRVPVVRTYVHVCGQSSVHAFSLYSRRTRAGQDTRRCRCCYRHACTASVVACAGAAACCCAHAPCASTVSYDARTTCLRTHVQAQLCKDDPVKFKATVQAHIKKDLKNTF